MNIYFSENLKKLRIQRKLTQEKLADFFGVTFQTISKWERGESYPDITLLPKIATFFNISIDDLLGVNQAKNEETISNFIYEYDNYYNDSDKKHTSILEMIEKYPNDFRIQLRYLGDLMFKNNGIDYKENLKKIQTIYNNIQENCTVDTIRICSKRYMAAYYNTLSHYSDSGITFADAEKIIREMPYMRDGQEFLFSYLYPHDSEDWVEYIQEAIEEEISLLYHGLCHYCLFPNSYDFSKEFVLDITEKVIAFLNYIYDDKNYGRMWRSIVYDYGHLGHMYFEIGNTEKAIQNLKISAELAKKFDNMPRVTVMHSKLFDGRKFDKETLGSTYVASSRMKTLMTEKYPLSDEFKKSEDFQNILKILDK